MQGTLGYNFLLIPHNSSQGGSYSAQNTAAKAIGHENHDYLLQLNITSNMVNVIERPSQTVKQLSRFFHELDLVHKQHDDDHGIMSREMIAFLQLKKSWNVAVFWSTRTNVSLKKRLAWESVIVRQICAIPVQSLTSH